jgi:4-hydroxy-3-polyprenylbenzoate decarboxylase
MRYRDLREFLVQLEALGELKRVAAPVSPRLELNEELPQVAVAHRPNDAAGSRSC